MRAKAPFYMFHHPLTGSIMLDKSLSNHIFTMRGFSLGGYCCPQGIAMSSVF